MISYRCALCLTPCTPVHDDVDLRLSDLICDGCRQWLADDDGAYKAWEGTLLYQRLQAFVAIHNLKRVIRHELRTAWRRLWKKEAKHAG